VSTFRLEPEHFHLTTGTFNLLSKTDPHFRLSGAPSVRANPLRNLCVLETFQSYRAPATAVNPLLAQDFHLFSTVRGVHPELLRSKPENSFLQRARKRASTSTRTRIRHKIRRRPKRKTTQKLKIAGRLCYSRKPFREPCPRMRTPKGVSWRLTELDAKSARDDSAGSSDTQSLVLGSIFYTKPPGFAQGGDQKSYCGRTEGIFEPVERRASRPSGRAGTPSSPPANSRR